MIIRGTLYMKYKILNSCMGCKQCYRVCPAKAITIGTMQINQDKCNMCGKCYKSCPSKKIIKVEEKE